MRIVGITFALLILPSLAHAKRELIFLILIDAVRPDHVGAYGYDRPTTPVLDELAAKGVRYTRAYANAPWTRSSTASFFTGLNGSRHQTETENSLLAAGFDTVARRLGRAGWRTAGFSANGNGGSLANLDEGFDLFEDPTSTYKRSESRRRCQKKYGKKLPPESAREDCIRYVGLPTGEFIVQRALDYLRTSTADKEFIFLFLVDSHDHKFSYYAPPRLERLFLGKPAPADRPRVIWEKDNDYSEPHRATIRALYDAGIRYADEALGQLLAGLGDDLENTTLVVAADHGEGFGEHGFYLHAHQFWEEVVRIPLVVMGPRFSTAVDSRLTQSLDVAATILDLAGADRSGIAGRSLLEPDVKTPVISEYNEFGIHRQAIVGERYKVIWQRPADEDWYMSSFSDRFSVEQKKAFFPSVTFDGEVVQVFDLEKDPEEKRNLSAAMPPAAAALLAKLRTFVATAP